MVVLENIPFVTDGDWACSQNFPGVKFASRALAAIRVFLTALGVPVALYLPRAEFIASEKSGSSITDEVFLFCVR